MIRPDNSRMTGGLARTVLERRPMIDIRCPICDQPLPGAGLADNPFAPFCSERCRRIDLGRWLGQKYRIPETDNSANPDVDHDDDVWD